MTDPASPAAVTEERVKSCVEELQGFVSAFHADQHLDLGCVISAADDASDLLLEALAALDARGLELARVRELADNRETEVLELSETLGQAYQQMAEAQARLAQANEAQTRPYHKLYNPFGPTPPAQSAGEALDPAGTGEDVASAIEDLDGIMGPLGASVRKNRDVLVSHIRAQASALAEARGVVRDVQADLIAYMLSHAADYSSAGPDTDQYKTMIAKLQSALTDAS